MRKILALASLVSLNALAVEVSLQNCDWTPATDNSVKLSVERVSGDTIRCKLVSNADGVRQFRITATEDFVGATRVWNGKDEKTFTGKRCEHPLYINHTFLMGALWNDNNGVALGTGAEDMNSYTDFVAEGQTLKVSVHATLMGRGAVYECTFHKLMFSPKYGIRDALAKYYMLYPRRFKRDSRVNPWIFGISAQYGSWRNADPETCRFMNATWEWCHGAGRSWGDMLNEQNPSGKMNDRFSWVEKNTYTLRDGKDRTFYNSKVSQAEFDAAQNSRFDSGYYCGVANGFYTMALANISNLIAERYPDSVATEHSMAPNDYFFAADVFTFEECSFGSEVRRQIKELVKKTDIGALAFDVSRPRSVYRGEKLKLMKNVSWDEFGPGIVRGVGSAKLFEFIRELPNQRLKGNTAVAVNTKYQHLSDLLYIDMTMFEMTPWDKDPPFPLSGRFALGEKGFTLWEGYSPREFDPNFNKWPIEDQTKLINDLAHYAVYRSLIAGASLPCAFMSEYASKISHAFVRMNDAGWKPVIGATTTDANWELARYGSADKSYLAVCNVTNRARKVELTIYPAELESGIVNGSSRNAGYLFAPFFGGQLEHAFSKSTEKIIVKTGASLSTILEAVASVNGEGILSAEWSGEAGEVYLTLISKDFRGEVCCRESFEGYAVQGARNIKFSGGETIRVKYVDGRMLAVAKEIKSLELKKLNKLTIECAADKDSKDIADRFAAFFKGVSKPKDRKKAKKHVSPVRIVENVNLKPRTIRIGTMEVNATEREDFSDFSRRVLNVLNATRYPNYLPQYKLDEVDAREFKFLRY